MLDPRNPVAGNVLTFSRSINREPACSSVCLLRTPRSDGTGPPLKWSLSEGCSSTPVVRTLRPRADPRRQEREEYEDDVLDK